MKKKSLILFSFLFVVLSQAFKPDSESEYFNLYKQKLTDFETTINLSITKIRSENLDRESCQDLISKLRLKLKALDFWIRYAEPIAYKKINGPLPVEWETEVFEKFEKPYRREGSGLTLAYIYSEEEVFRKDSILSYLIDAKKALKTYWADTIVETLKSHHHFYLSNRLYLLNLAAIYTSGFECPDTEKIIIELKELTQQVNLAYSAFNKSFISTPISDEYLSRYKELINFINSQPDNFEKFDHFTFIKEHVNPLFALNQDMINDYGVHSSNNLDYTLNKSARSIFSKNLYVGQNHKGIFTRVIGKEDIALIDSVGKMLYFDPILSGNNKRSCASCHHPNTAFTDTSLRTSPDFSRSGFLPRNSPSLLNVKYNHLIMADGKHISLQDQAKDVITNKKEMGSNEEEVVKKVLSCKEYKKIFSYLLKLTPQEKQININHITSALTFYYGKFSQYYSSFDMAMNKAGEVSNEVKEGFNIYMSKAQCATCHFVPMFNGVKPPYIGSEFEVLGTPANKDAKQLSIDSGRYHVNPSRETLRAFRTGTLRNASLTAPYMHNGVFNSLREVIDFYDAGGGIGHGLNVPNQTLSSDSLKLNEREKKLLIVFMESLNETVPNQTAPKGLPFSSLKTLNTRKPGGEY